MEGLEIVHVTLVRTPPWREGLSVIDRRRCGDLIRHDPQAPTLGRGHGRLRVLCRQTVRAGTLALPLSEQGGRRIFHRGNGPERLPQLALVGGLGQQCVRAFVGRGLAGPLRQSQNALGDPEYRSLAKSKSGAFH